MSIKTIDVIPILIPDSPVLNFSGIHNPFTPRLVIRMILENGITGYSEVPYSGSIYKIASELAKADGPVLNRPINEFKAVLQDIE